MTVKLLTGHHLEFLSLTRDRIGSSVSILVKMPHCWKSHVAAHISFYRDFPLLVGHKHIRMLSLLYHCIVYIDENLGRILPNKEEDNVRSRVKSALVRLGCTNWLL